METQISGPHPDHHAPWPFQEAEAGGRRAEAYWGGEGSRRDWAGGRERPPSPEVGGNDTTLMPLPSSLPRACPKQRVSSAPTALSSRWLGASLGKPRKLFLKGRLLTAPSCAPWRDVSPAALVKSLRGSAWPLFPRLLSPRLARPRGATSPYGEAVFQEGSEGTSGPGSPVLGLLEEMVWGTGSQPSAVIPWGTLGHAWRHSACPDWGRKFSWHLAGRSRGCC